MNIKVIGTKKMKTSKGGQPKNSQILPRQVSPPPSKSHSIRFLLLAALAKGESKIDNILVSDDIRSTYRCLKVLGVHFEYEHCDEESENVRVIPPKLGVFNYAINNKELCLNVGNSGTLLYMLSMLIAGIPAIFHIKGDMSIKKRPIEPVLEALEALGVTYALPQSNEDSLFVLNNEQTLPHQSTTCKASSYEIITIYGKRMEKEANVYLEGKFSQVVSGLLIASAFWDAKTHIFLKTAGEAPYIIMTLQHLKRRGIHININKELTKYECFGRTSVLALFTKDSGKDSYIESFYETVPNDWSQSSFLALASIASSLPLLISPLSMDELQADSILIEYLQRLGCQVHFENDGLRLGGNSTLNATLFNLSNTPDSLPYLAALCSLAKGVSRLEGVEICRFKECDRVHAMCVELGKLGVNITEEHNRLIIEGVIRLKSGARLCTYGDHRIAMALIALCLSLQKDEWCIIEEVDCCQISYPTFLQTLKCLDAIFVVIN